MHNHLIKTLFPLVMGIFSFVSVQPAMATPIDLGLGEDYTILALDSIHTGTVGLGSASNIIGNVGAQTHLTLGAGSTIHGDFNGGTVVLEGGAEILGTQTTKTAGYWTDVRNDLDQAQALASAGTATTYGLIEDSLTLSNSGGISYYDFASGLDLAAGEYLTFSGSGEFVVNISSMFEIYAGAGILLEDGASGDNILFNFTGIGDARINGTALGATAFGTFLAPNWRFTVGDGVTQNQTRYLVDQFVGNVQTVSPPGPIVVIQNIPEPASLTLMLSGLVLLCALGRRRKIRHR